MRLLVSPTTLPSPVDDFGAVLDTAFEEAAPSGGNASTTVGDFPPLTAPRILLREFAHTDPAGIRANAFACFSSELFLLVSTDSLMLVLELVVALPLFNICCCTLVVVESQTPDVFARVAPADDDDVADVFDGGEPAAVVVMPPAIEVSNHVSFVPGTSVLEVCEPASALLFLLYAATAFDMNRESCSPTDISPEKS